MPKIIDDQEVYHAVIQTILERGYAGATTRQIAEAAGVSEVTLFRKYENKQQLVKRAITALVQQADFESAIRYTGDIHADLLRVLQAYQNSAISYAPFFAVLLSEISRDPELSEAIAEPFRLFQSIGELIARYQHEGALRVEDPFHAAAALLGPLIYSAMMRGMIPNQVFSPFDLRTHVNLYLQGRGAQAEKQSPD